MTPREVLQALLDGKSVRGVTWAPTTSVNLDGRGTLRWTETGDPATVDLFKSLRMTEFEVVVHNPHPKGSFPWAVFEIEHGKKVRRRCWMSPFVEKGFTECVFMHANNVLATDWEVVS